MKRTASAHWTGTVKEGKGELTTQSTTLEHTAYSYNSRFENGKGTNPEELIAAAHAGCFTMATSLMLGQAGFTPEALDTTATLTMSMEGGPKITAVHLALTAKVPGIAEDKFQEVAQQAKANCPVSQVLKAEITLEAKLVH